MTFGLAPLKREGKPFALDDEAIDIIATDYGNVRLTARTLAYLESQHPHWRTSRAKAARLARLHITQIASTLAAIEWHAGGQLKKL